MSGFALTIALRFLREGRFQSILIIIGVAAGVGVVAYISALIEGLQGNTIRRTLGTQAHVVIKPPEERARPSRAALPGETIARTTLARAQPKRKFACRGTGGAHGIFSAAAQAWPYPRPSLAFQYLR